jgi:O-antigen/teichoic acid export membrane protein
VLVQGTDPRPFLRFYGSVSLILGVPVALGGVLLARDVIVTVYGPDYASGIFAFQVLCLTAGLMFLSSMYGSQLPLLGRQRLLLVDVCAGAAVNVALNLILVPTHSLDGAAVATLAAELVVFVLMVYQNRDFLGIRELAHSASSPFVAGGALLLLYVAAAAVMPAPGALLLAFALYGFMVCRPHVRLAALHLGHHG